MRITLIERTANYVVVRCTGGVHFPISYATWDRFIKKFGKMTLPFNVPKKAREFLTTHALIPM